MARKVYTGKITHKSFVKEETGQLIPYKEQEYTPAEAARLKALVRTLGYPKRTDGMKECGCYPHPNIPFCKHQDPEEEMHKQKGASALAKKAKSKGRPKQRRR